MTECAIPTIPFWDRGFSRRRTHRKQRQFAFRDAKPRKAALQTDQELREYQKSRIGKMFQAGEMDHHLCIEFRISALNSASFTEAHDAQDMKNLAGALVCASRERVSVQNCTLLMVPASRQGQGSLLRFSLFSFRKLSQASYLGNGVLRIGWSRLTILPAKGRCIM